MAAELEVHVKVDEAFRRATTRIIWWLAETRL